MNSTNSTNQKISVKDLIIKYENEIARMELQYRLTGKYNELEKLKYCAGKEIGELLKQIDLDKDYQINKYNTVLKYYGDQELLFEIFSKEKDFRLNRKKIEKKVYQEKLSELVVMRNKYANTAGFADYLEYRYALWGIDNKLLKKKINELSEKGDDNVCDSVSVQELKKINDDSRFHKENQILLLKKTLSLLELPDLNDKIILHTDGLPQFYLGSCIPCSIPNEIHLLVNLVSGLNGFAMLMHEMGHAIYYSMIDSTLNYNNRRPYNLVFEEGIALFFENIVYSNEFLASNFETCSDFFRIKPNRPCYIKKVVLDLRK